MQLDTLVKNGLVVTPRGIRRADIGIRGDRIAAVRTGLKANPETTRILDAEGHYVLPGAIDAHVHLDLPCGTLTTADDYCSGTRAAARGGVTTVIDFATPEAGGSLAKAVDAWMGKAEGKALIDYSFHLAITNWTTQKKEIKSLISRGFPTFKQYMIYRSRGLYSDDRAMFCALEVLRDAGGLLLAHAESQDVLDELISRYHTREWMCRMGARLHALSRPNYVEAEAVQRAIAWSEATGGPLYIVHLSTAEGAGWIREARRRGVHVRAETCPHYLVLDDSVYARPDGHLFACSPQMKMPRDAKTLWQALRDEVLSVVATDTCTFTRAQKNTWKGDFTRIPNGLPGVETLLPILYTHGVLKKRITLEQLCRFLASNPARIMGLYPRKGVIQAGADADLLLIHPTARQTIDPERMESRADWSPYAGWKLAGFPRTVLSRGDVIVEDSRIVGRKGRGCFLPRGTPDLRPA